MARSARLAKADETLTHFRPRLRGQPESWPRRRGDGDYVLASTFWLVYPSGQFFI